MATGDCECIAGRSRGPCSHKNSVAKYFNVAEFTILPEMSPESRGLYHFLGTGSTVADSFYRDLEHPDQVPHVADFVSQHTQGQEPLGNIVQPDEDNVDNIDMLEENSDLNSSLDDTENDGSHVKEFDDVIGDVRETITVNPKDKSLKKATQYFVKEMRKAVRGNIQTLVQTFYTVGRQLSAAKKSGRKRNSTGIPVQPTSMSRRVGKHRGRGKAPSGRRPKDQRQRLQFIITEDTEDCDTARTLPGQRKPRSRRPHSLMENVRDNVAHPPT